jgi:archaellum biogenesis protein FlaJ (TadC family)
VQGTITRLWQADAMPAPPEDQSADDEERERYRELLEELRTIIPGVQVLFAFLLTVPFSSRFTDLDDLGVRVFALALVTVGLAAVIFLTPAAYHRIAPRDDRHHRLRLGIRSTVAGMALLGVSVGAAVFVVIRLIFAITPLPLFSSQSPTTIAAAAMAIVAGAALVLWFLLPLLSRGRGGH